MQQPPTYRWIRLVLPTLLSPMMTIFSDYPDEVFFLRSRFSISKYTRNTLPMSMHTKSPHHSTINLKSIIQSALEQEEAKPDPVQSMLQTFLQRNKLFTMSRLERANRNLAVFKDLNNFVNVSQVFKYVQRGILQFVKEQIGQQAEAAEECEQVKPQQQAESFAAKMQVFNQKISEAFGKKLQRMNEENALHIESVFDGILKEYPAASQEQFDALLKILKQLDEEREVAKRNQKRGTSYLPLKKLNLTSRQKHQTELYFEQALALMTVILKRRKKKFVQSTAPKHRMSRSVFSNLRNTNAELPRSPGGSRVSIRTRSNRYNPKGSQSLHVPASADNTTTPISTKNTIKRKSLNRKKHLVWPQPRLENRTLKKLANVKYFNQSFDRLIQDIDNQRKYCHQNKGIIEKYMNETEDMGRMAEEEYKLIVRDVENSIIWKNKRNLHGRSQKSMRGLGL